MGTPRILEKKELAPAALASSRASSAANAAGVGSSGWIQNVSSVVWLRATEPELLGPGSSRVCTSATLLKGTWATTATRRGNSRRHSSDATHP